MKATIGFLFFMLFLAGLAFVNLRSSQNAEDAEVTSLTELTDVAWKLTHLGEMVMEESAEVFIQFDANGQFGGNAGCNRFFGGAQFGETLDLGEVGATRRYCPEPTNSLEFSFLEALGNTSAVARLDTRLALKDADGVNLLRFTAIPRQTE